MSNDEKQTIETMDEEGKMIPFELLDIFEFEGKEYSLLLPVEETNEKEDLDAILMRLVKHGENYSFETIEDEKEFDKVSEYLDNRDEEEE